MNTIAKAIFTMGGRARRFSPVSQWLPKEVLPMGDKPILQYVFEELVESGVASFLFVLSPKKSVIRDLFGNGDDWKVSCDYIETPGIRGPGGAVLLGEAWTNREPFIVALPDSILFDSQIKTLKAPLCVRSLIDHFFADSLDVAFLAENSQYLTAATKLMPPNRIVCLAADPSSMSADCAAIKPCATWIFSNSIFEELRKAYNADIQKEIRLPDVVNSLVAKNTVKAIPLQNGVVRYNINTWEDYFNVLQNAGIQSRNPFVG